MIVLEKERWIMRRIEESGGKYLSELLLSSKILELIPQIHSSEDEFIGKFNKSLNFELSFL